MNSVYTLICTLCVLVACASAEDSAPAAESLVVELTDKQYDATIRTGDTWLIMFYATFCGEPCAKVEPILESIAAKHPTKLRVGKIRHDQDLVRRFSATEYPSLIVVRDGKYYIVDIVITMEEQVEKFALGGYKDNVAHKIPPREAYKTYVVELTDENFETRVFNKRGAYWVVLFYNHSDYENTAIKHHYEGLALMERGKVNVAAIEGKNVRAFRTMKIENTPTLLVIRGGTAYNMEGTPFEFNNEDMKKFAEGGYVNSTQKFDVKPSGVGAEAQNIHSDVITLTEDNFDEITGVVNGDKGIWFIEFYAPWCGHCKALAPIWEEVATTVRERMKVAKVDCIENKKLSDRFDIPGFPTLLLFDKKKFYKYDGEKRLKEDFIQFATEGYKSKEGWVVPLPDGQTRAPPTFVEQAERIVEDFWGVHEVAPWAIYSMVGGSAALGFTVVAYYMVMRYLLKYASQMANQQREGPVRSPKKVEGKPTRRPVRK